ncbi:MAG: FUN14 domain-containing protein [Deinococcales bacterium]
MTELTRINGINLSPLSFENLSPILAQLGVGGALGFATGYALKKVGKLALVAVGLLFLILQLAAFYGYVNIDWLKIQENLNPFFETESLNRQWQQFLFMITANLPFAGGFVPMFLVGLKMG